MKKTILLALLCFCTLSVQLKAQSSTENTRSINSTPQSGNSEEKRDLTSEDYRLWEQLKSQSISDNGAWYTYSLSKNRKSVYGYKERGLYVGSTGNDISYHFPYGGSGQFSTGSSWFACLVPEKGLGLLNLKKGSKQWIADVTKFEFSPDGSYLIYKKPGETNTSTLIILNLKSGRSNTIAGVEEYLMSPGSNHLVYIQNTETLIILNLKNNRSNTIAGVEEYLMSPGSNHLAYIQNTETEQEVKFISLSQTASTSIARNKLRNYKNLVWDTEGTSLAFLEEQLSDSDERTRYKIYCYRTTRGKPILYKLDPATDASIFLDRYILKDGFKLQFSPKGSALYFKTQNPEDKEKSISNEAPDAVEVWHSGEKELYSTRKKNQLRKGYGAKLVSWHPETGKIAVLETNALPKAILSNDGKYMLSYDPLLHAPSFATTVNKDLYLTDLKTGASHLFLEAYGGEARMSPNSRYIDYFKDKHWWIYDLEKKTHTNVTKNLSVAWHVDFPKHPHKNGLQAYGSPGWTNGDKKLVLYDKYDVWLISPTGEARRITQGRESQISHRIYNKYKLYRGAVKSFTTWFTSQSHEINPSEGLVFKTKGADKASGYTVWKFGKKPKVLVYKNMQVSDLRKSHNKEAYTYVEQSFNTAPRIRYLEKGLSGSRLLKASNLQQKQFYWGHSELVSYKGPDGEDLHGALYYPANYSLGEKYPMIVEVYERLSGSLHRYVNPTEYNRDRLNRTNYTTAGYFMFYPDINYSFNEVGMSAVRCVEAGVKAVLAKGEVEADHIGLTGHSFGGYETNFIITQSSLFAAAVAGAGTTDLVSSYHSIENIGNNMQRFEDWQYCFNGPFYKEPEAYIRNSPLHQVATINTPLLLWAGKDDPTVDYRQSLELYLGLRRLNKTCDLLLYPGDKHNLMKAENQIDRTRRIKAWFDKYLKPDER